jgi:hypothetical protein
LKGRGFSRAASVAGLKRIRPPPESDLSEIDRRESIAFRDVIKLSLISMPATINPSPTTSAPAPAGTSC